MKKKIQAVASNFFMFLKTKRNKEAQTALGADDYPELGVGGPSFFH